MPLSGRVPGRLGRTVFLIDAYNFLKVICLSLCQMSLKGSPYSALACNQLRENALHIFAQPCLIQVHSEYLGIA